MDRANMVRSLTVWEKKLRHHKNRMSFHLAEGEIAKRKVERLKRSLAGEGAQPITAMKGESHDQKA